MTDQLHPIQDTNTLPIDEADYRVYDLSAYTLGSVEVIAPPDSTWGTTHVKVYLSNQGATTDGLTPSAVLTSSSRRVSNLLLVGVRYIIVASESNGGFDSSGEKVVLNVVADANPMVVGSSFIEPRGNDPALAVAAGWVPGQTHINKFGQNDTVAADTTEDIWDGGGTYSFPSTADITHVSQDTDQAAMRGEVVEVQGLDTNWNLVTQMVTLDGSDTTTAVALGTALRRVFRLKVDADVVADQDIRAHNSGDTTTYATIQAGNNQTLMAIYTVPANKCAYVTNIYASVVNATAKSPTSTDVRVWAADRANGYEFQLKGAFGLASGGAGFKQYNPYIRFTEKTDIKMTAYPEDQPANVYAGFDIVLVDC